MEAVVNRRCIAIKTMFGVKIELILVHNTSTSHDRYSLKALPQELSGSVEYTPTEPVPNPSDPMKFDKRMLRVDIDKVKSMKLLCNSLTKMIDGLTFVDEEENELGRAFFLGADKEHPNTAHH